MTQTPFRKGRPGDEEWLFELFRTTMQDHIHQAWGWEELLQREGFITSLPAREFHILEAEGEAKVEAKEEVEGKARVQAVGCYHLTSKPDHLLLDIIMVPPRWQGRGYGRCLMEEIQRHSQAAGLPLRLRVLQTNPAVDFHRRLGFVEYGRDRHSLEMVWQPD